MKNSSDTWVRVAAGLAAAGGAAWTVKFVVILADGGGDAGGLTAVLYLAGLVLMFAGSVFVGGLAARGRGPIVLVPAIVLSPLLVFVSYVLLDGVAQAVVGDAGPGWLEHEVGILVTGLFWLAAGLWGRRSAGRGERATGSLASGAA